MDSATREVRDASKGKESSRPGGVSTLSAEMQEMFDRINSSGPTPTTPGTIPASIAMPIPAWPDRLPDACALAGCGGNAGPRDPRTSRTHRTDPGADVLNRRRAPCSRGRASRCACGSWRCGSSPVRRTDPVSALMSATGARARIIGRTWLHLRRATPVGIASLFEVVRNLVNIGELFRRRETMARETRGHRRGGVPRRGLSERQSAGSRLLRHVEDSAGRLWTAWRWPQGFVQNARAAPGSAMHTDEIKERKLYQCGSCRHQATASTNLSIPPSWT